MPVLTETHHALIGKETAPQPLPEAVNIAMARHWCEMVEDANPIYFEEKCARAGGPVRAEVRPEHRGRRRVLQRAVLDHRQ